MGKVPADADGDLELSDAIQQATCIGDYVDRAVDPQGRKISEGNLTPVLLVVMGADSVSTSSLLSWLMYCMVASPEMQELLLQDYIDRGINEDIELHVDRVNSLHSQENFIKETQRLMTHPISLLAQRAVTASFREASSFRETASSSLQSTTQVRLF